MEAANATTSFFKVVLPLLYSIIDSQILPEAVFKENASLPLIRLPPSVKTRTLSFPIISGNPACNAVVSSPPLIQGGDMVKIEAAGIPNIKGKIDVRVTENDIIPYTEYPNSSLFLNGRSKTYDTIPVSLTKYAGAVLTISADRSNSIYGNSDTVQPPAIILIPQIKN